MVHWVNYVMGYRSLRNKKAFFELLLPKDDPGFVLLYLFLWVKGLALLGVKHGFWAKHPAWGGVQIPGIDAIARTIRSK